MDRRHALKIMAAAAASPTLAGCGPSDEPGSGPGTSSGTGDVAATPGGREGRDNPLARGDAWDPDLLSPEIPWERVLTEDELDSLAALVDVIIPADDRSPAASEVGAHDYIDEWVSAPYSGMERDRVTVRGGLIWLDREAASRFGEGLRFRDLSDDQKTAICDDIAYAPDAAPELESAARFFAKVRDLTATAFYTTDEGMADIGYVGNTPLAEWGPPPPEALRHLGLDPEAVG